MHCCSPLLLAAAPVAVLAAPAGAATVSLERVVYHDPGAPGKVPPVTVVTGVLHYASAAGEANRVSVGEAGGGNLVVRDAGAPLAAGAGCAAGAGEVVCAVEAGARRALRIDLADGDDALDVTLTGTTSFLEPTQIVAGPGDDFVSAHGGAVLGGDGDDTLSARESAALRGGPGADRITGGGGNDEVDGGPGTDALDGGTGRDTLSYAGRAEPVILDLGAATAGAAGENDAIAGFEDAEGGDGPDVLRAAPGAAARLRGGGGDDVLEGGPLQDELAGEAGDDRLTAGAALDQLDGGDGNDQLDGGPGIDHVDGGPGADVASSGPGRDYMSGGGGADVFGGDAGNDAIDTGTAAGGDGDDTLEGRVLDGGDGDDRLTPEHERGVAASCGAGRDVVEHPPLGLVLLTSACERVTPVSYWRPAIPTRPALHARSVAIALPYPCSDAPSMARCRVTGTLSVGGRPIATTRARWRRHAPETLRWPVTRRVRGAIGRGAVVRFSLVLRQAGSGIETRWLRRQPDGARPTRWALGVTVTAPARPGGPPASA